jgi:tetratricopeptide (TPR) repeat protein
MLKRGVSLFQQGKPHDAKDLWEKVAEADDDYSRYAINNLACYVYVNSDFGTDSITKFVDCLNKLADKYNDDWAKVTRGIFHCGGSHVLWSNTFNPSVKKYADEFFRYINPEKGILQIEEVMNKGSKHEFFSSDYAAISSAYYMSSVHARNTPDSSLSLNALLNNSLSYMKKAIKETPPDESHFLSYYKSMAEKVEKELSSM